MCSEKYTKLLTNQLQRISQNEYKIKKKLSLTLVLDNIRSMHNIGAAFRSADAFCIEQIILCGISAIPPRKEITKTALGAEEHVCWQYYSSTLEAIQNLKKKNFTIVGIEQTTNSIELSSFKVNKNNKYALVFGHEINGVSQEVLNQCDLCCEIGQFGVKNSLNVSVAIGIISWYLSTLLRN